MMMKELINADEYEFVIKVMPHKMAHGLFLCREGYPEHILAENWFASELKDFIFSRFIGEKGTHFNITIEEGTVKKDENGLLYLQPKGGN